MRHTEQQVTEALALMGISNRTHAKALEAQLRADNPGAWFLIAGRRLRAAKTASAEACDRTTASVAKRHGGAAAYATERRAACKYDN